MVGRDNGELCKAFRQAQVQVPVQMHVQVQAFVQEEATNHAMEVGKNHG